MSRMLCRVVLDNARNCLLSDVAWRWRFRFLLPAASAAGAAGVPRAGAALLLPEVWEADLQPTLLPEAQEEGTD